MFREIFEGALNNIWEGFRELAETHSESAPTLARNANDGVARLAQSTAFAVASILERLQDDGQSLLRPLIAQGLPEYLRPRPSSTILELKPARVRSTNAQGATFDARAAFPLPFRVMWPVTPGPFELVDVHVDRPHATLQTLHLALKGRDGAALGTVLPDRLRFFVHLEPATAAIDVIHALRASQQPISIQTFDADGRPIAQGHLPRDAFAWVCVDTDEPSLVSAPEGRFRSGTLLDDLFTFPESHFFFEVSARSFCSERVARVELVLPLARVVEHASSMSATNVRLFCAPATNEFEAPLESLITRGGTREWMLLVAERRHAEILHVQSIYAESQEGHVPILSLEAPEHPHTLEPGLVYYRLRQTIARDESRTEARLSLATRQGFRTPAPAAIIHGRVLASDGALTRTLGLGDVAGRNITRVSPSRRAILDKAIPRRMNAFARMSARQLAEPEHLNEFVRLHAHWAPLYNLVAAPRFLAVAHQAERRALPGGRSQNGDDFQIRIDTSPCTDGEAWVIGERVSRALSERDERVRFSRLAALRNRGRSIETFATYDARDGERCSFPLG